MKRMLVILTILAARCYSRDLPNVIVLLADDLGRSDLPCYGNDTVTTPNIDRLCREGLRLDHHTAAASICTPSRAAFMTGRYAGRMGMAGDAGTPAVQMYVSSAMGLPENETTWADLLGDHGYDTAAVGKWHLGWDKDVKGDQKHGPLGHGFQYFFGIPYTLVEGFELKTSFFTYTRHGAEFRSEVSNFPDKRILPNDGYN